MTKLLFLLPIVTLATKLNVSPKKEWILTVIITDGSASRQVNISHDFLKVNQSQMQILFFNGACR